MLLPTPPVSDSKHVLWRPRPSIPAMMFFSFLHCVWVNLRQFSMLSRLPPMRGQWSSDEYLVFRSAHYNQGTQKESRPHTYCTYFMGGLLEPWNICLQLEDAESRFGPDAEEWVPWEYFIAIVIPADPNKHLHQRLTTIMASSPSARIADSLSLLSKSVYQVVRWYTRLNCNVIEIVL